MIFTKICIASDHAGYDLKEKIKDYLINKGMPIIDLGPRSPISVDYPDYAKKLAKRLISKKSDSGILICGSGTGMAITANKFKGIRAAQCYSKKSTILSRQHNNANVICVGSRMIKKKRHLVLLIFFLKLNLKVVGIKRE